MTYDTYMLDVFNCKIRMSISGKSMLDGEKRPEGDVRVGDKH